MEAFFREFMRQNGGGMGGMGGIGGMPGGMRVEFGGTSGMGGMGGVPGGMRVEFGSMPGMGDMGGQPRKQAKPFPQAEMDGWIRADVASIHAASRASGVSEDRDAVRASLAGQPCVISLVDTRDRTVKVCAPVCARARVCERV